MPLPFCRPPLSRRATLRCSLFRLITLRHCLIIIADVAMRPRCRAMLVLYFTMIRCFMLL